MNEKKGMYIFANTYTFLLSIPSGIELYLEGKGIINISLFFAGILVSINMLVFIMYFIINKVFKWLEKRSIERYNFYEWLGNPQQPIDFFKILSNKKDFNPKNFKENCIWLKREIKEHAKDFEGLKHYKTYLEFKNNSPRLNSAMGSFQTIMIAVVTSSLITLLNFANIKTSTIVISYIFFLVSLIGLGIVIDFMSKKIDRNRLLLTLVNECIKEEKRKSSSNNIVNIEDDLKV